MDTNYGSNIVKPVLLSNNIENLNYFEIVCGNIQGNVEVDVSEHLPEYLSVFCVHAVEGGHALDGDPGDIKKFKARIINNID